MLLFKGHRIYGVNTSTLQKKHSMTTQAPFKGPPSSLFLIALALILATFSISHSVHAQSSLPQDHAYQVDLYNWLEGISIQDVTIPTGPIQLNSSGASIDQVADLFMMTQDITVFDDSPRFAFQGDPKWFVLDDGQGAGIQGSGSVKMLRWANEAAFVYNLDVPNGGGQGNPYFQNTAMCTRALVSTAVDLIMLDYAHQQNISIRSDYLGGTLNALAYAYDTCNEILDANEQAAFESGFDFMMDKLLQWGPRQVNTNMDTRAISTVSYLYRASSNDAFKDKAMRVAKRFMFGSETGTIDDLDRGLAIFMKAGYVSEARGPETTYNGVSLHHILESCAITNGFPEWEFMVEPCMRMIDFKLYQYFHDPNSGFYDGPAGYANRTGDSYVYDQQGHLFRDIVAADFHPTEKALARNFRWPGNTKIPDQSDLPEFIQTGLDRLGRYGLGSTSTGTPDDWLAQHWPPSHPILATPGWYTRLKNLLDTNDPLIQTPYERQDAINRVFGDEFWVYKSNDGSRDFGYFVEHIPSQWPYDSWAGGSLQTFWTEDTGIVVLSKHDKAGDEQNRGEDTRVFSLIESWGAHHVWGYDDEGFAFTTAAWNDIGQGVLTLSTDTGAERYIEYRTGFADGRGWSAVGDPNGQGIDTTRALLVSRFTALQNGIRIQRTITSDGSINVTDFWETLPIFMRDCAPPYGTEGDDGLQCQYSDTEIAYWNGSGYTAMNTTMVNTTRIRLTRDFGAGPRHVYIAFDESRRARLAEEPWIGSYMSDNTLRNLHIDLKGSDGTISMPATTSLTYTITTAEGTPPPPGNQIPTVSLTSPVDGTLFTPPANISIAASASDIDGQITKVEFFENDVKLGEDINGADGWTFDWMGVSDGNYVLTAVAIDDSSATNTSEAINVSVGLVPPIADDQKVFTDIDSPVSFSLEASDPNGDPLTYTVLTTPSNGALSGNAPDLTYTPNAGFEGDDTFTYMVNDGTANSGVATVTISVGGVRDLFAFWPFEGSGDTIIDETGNGNDGAFTGGGTRTSDGRSGNAVSFNGQDACVDLGTIDISGEGMSIVVWFYANSFQTPDARLISKATSSQPNDHWWMLSTIESGGKMLLRYRLKTETGGTAELIADEGTLETNEWILGVVTYDGSTMSIYKDGLLVASAPKTGALSTDANVTALLGCNPGADHTAAFDGSIDEVQIYTRALSAEEIATLYDGNEPPKPTSTEDPANVGAFVLHPNYPNPFRGETTMTIEVPRTSSIELSVFDISGRIVSTLMNDVVSAGTHRIKWNNNGLTSGTYLIRLKTEEGIQYQSMTVLN